MNNPILRAVGYRRVSMREQVDGHSLAAQETNIRQYAESQGWDLTRIYTDAGLSAKKDSNRPALNELLRDAKAGKFDVVVVDKLDRFYRHLRGLLSSLDMLNESRVSFVSVQERLDFTSVWGKLTLTVLGTLAEVYIDNLRQETRKGKLQRARDGLWNGNLPFGYCRGVCSKCQEISGAGYCPRFGDSDIGDGKHLVLHPMESKIIRQMYEWYAEGDTSDAKIAVKLGEMELENGVKPRSRGTPGRSMPGPIQKDLVRGVLNNLFYTGVIPYYGPKPDGGQVDRHPQHIFPGQHPAIISTELYEKVQEVRRALGKTPHNRKATASPRDYLLTGILRCGYCGRNMRGSSAKGSHYYYRDSTNIEKIGDCPQHSVRAEIIDEQFLAWLRETLKDQSELERMEAQQNMLEQAENRYGRAQELYLGGQLLKPAFEAEAIRYELAKKTLQENDQGAMITQVKEIQRKLAGWDNFTRLNRKRLFLLRQKQSISGTAF
jgi:site-specific DNA recombinase